MDINKLIKEAHENSIKHGFYECPNCNGRGTTIQYIGPRDAPAPCTVCHGDKIDKNANIPEKLMLVVSELGEAQEALRKNKRADWRFYESEFNKFKPWTTDENILKIDCFASCIKDTFEDEIADVYIRLADLCGYLHIEPHKTNECLIENKTNISEMLFDIVKLISEYNDFIKIYTDDVNKHYWSAMCFNALNKLCEHLKIDINKHITAKMTYNATRPYKHGKEF